MNRLIQERFPIYRKAHFSSDPESYGPWYIQWVAWCWERPIYIGLPLSGFTLLLVFADMAAVAVYLLSRWGKRYD